MAKALNRVTLIGNLGQDPELRSTPSGSSVCSFSLATTESYKDRNGEWQDNTEWHRIVLWEGLAETAAKYLKKGSKTYIEGKLQTRSYEKDGITRYITEIRGLNVIFLDRPGESGGSGGFNNSNDSYSQTSSSSSNEDSGHFQTEEDDDIPF